MELSWIVEAATELGGSAREHSHPNAHSQEFAGKQARLFDATQSWSTCIAVPACDERAVEVLASGLPLFHGAQLAVDITLRCVRTASGMPRPGAATMNSIVCAGARVDKERKYVELLSGDRCRLVVVAMETGGRWSPEAVEFVDNLAAARAREAPPLLQRSTVPDFADLLEEV